MPWFNYTCAVHIQEFLHNHLQKPCQHTSINNMCKKKIKKNGLLNLLWYSALTRDKNDMIAFISRRVLQQLL